MGFWSGLTKIIQGQPVFETPETEKQVEHPLASIAGPSPAATPVDSTGHKIIPEVLFEHCESHLNGSEVDVTVWATNQSSVEIELDKIVMLGLTTQLDRFLAPGEAHQLRLYRGRIPTNDSYHTAYLYYKQVSSGDYFQADFTIEYNYDSRGFYEVEELHPIHPIKDI
jgi:hypothetical protein